MALPVPEKVTLKDPKDFRLIGQPTTRLDAQAKSSGRQDFGIDMRLPGQLTAVVARPPVFGARLEVGGRQRGARHQRREGRAARAAGPRRRRRGRGGRWLLAGQAGPRRAQAANGTPRPSRRWTARSSSRSTANWPTSPARASSTPTWRRWPPRRSKIEAEFVFPYLAHAPMEPLNCTVQPADGARRAVDRHAVPGLDGVAAAHGAGPQARAGEGARADGGRRLRPARSCARSDFVVEACEVAKAARAAGLERAGAHAVEPRGRHQGRLLPPDAPAPRRIGFDDAGKVAGLGPRHRRPVHH